MKKFSSRTWLNPEGHPSSGSLVIYDGPSPWSKGNTHFIEFADCHGSTRFHAIKTDSDKDWRKKIDLMIRDLSEYNKWLKKNTR